MACLLGEAAVIERLHAAGIVAKTTSATEFKMRIAGDVAKWASVIADAIWNASEASKAWRSSLVADQMPSCLRCSVRGGDDES